MSTAHSLALVTGATSGIGQAYARRLAAQGYTVIAVGRRLERLQALAAEFPAGQIKPVEADLSTPEGINRLSEICREQPLTLLINNAGVSHYMGFTALSAEKAHELLQVKVMAPTLLAHAAAPGMVERKMGTIINVAGMLAFGATAPLGQAAGRATYVASLSHLLSLSLALSEELKSTGVDVQVLCPGIVATEFHERQGMDLSALPRMSAEEVVTASLRALETKEVVCAPGVEHDDLLREALAANLRAFGGQSPTLATRYQ
ncbi:SDR family NAD(P)-dependent oxidoreductase [Enterobacteriaceae bacterium RIT691]|nr:SDR family NAD(P)-dependent oxidoreductase [Enterobacteriaceae bacterium RIT691]